MKLRKALFILAVLLIAIPLLARTPRGHKAKYQFRKTHPCPSTGKTKGPCPGWIADHKIPLCMDGPDHPDNFQWITVTEAKVKDRKDKRDCQILRRQKKL